MCGRWRPSSGYLKSVNSGHGHHQPYTASPSRSSPFLIGAAAYGRAVGCLGALILVLSYGFLNSARFAMLDTMVTCAIYLALFGYVRLRERGEH